MKCLVTYNYAGKRYAKKFDNIKTARLFIKNECGDCYFIVLKKLSSGACEYY